MGAGRAKGLCKPTNVPIEVATGATGGFSVWATVNVDRFVLRGAAILPARKRHPRDHSSWVDAFVAGQPLLSAKLLYLTFHLIERPPQHGLKPRPPVVGEVARESPSFLEEHAHALQLDKL